MEKIINKIALVSSVLLLSVFSHAGNNRSWEYGSVESDITPLIKAVVFENGLSELNVGITFPSDDCADFSEKVLSAPSYEINGTLVKMLAQCIGQGRRVDFPDTSAGRAYVVNQFKTQESVSYKQDDFLIRFSAVDFTKEVAKLKTQTDGI